VYSVLLEYCCKTNYRMLISEMTLSYEKKLSDEIERNLKEKNAYEQHEKHLRQKLDELQRDFNEKTKTLEDEVSLRMKL
jgi:hypothetical protein